MCPRLNRKVIASSLNAPKIDADLKWSIPFSASSLVPSRFFIAIAQHGGGEGTDGASTTPLWTFTLNAKRGKCNHVAMAPVPREALAQARLMLGQHASPTAISRVGGRNN